jgi:hypothetical protein
MLNNATQLKGFSIHAQDGDLGTVDDFYFDDHTWTVRYLTLETGSWLSGRSVLISPASVIRIDWQLKRLDVALTKHQIEHSPDIDTHRPVSRQHEIEYLRYYGYAPYWSDPLSGIDYYPGGLLVPSMVAVGLAPPVAANPEDSHLRSNSEVTGYAIAAADGEIGHVAGFIVDDADWKIRYIEVATKNWLPGKKVLISPTWISRVSWDASAVFTVLTREAIRTAPEYVASSPVTRESEDALYIHYGQPPYWP